jgi:excisionase family DNA binding protein
MSLATYEGEPFVFSIAGFCKSFGFSRGKVDGMIKSGEIRASRIGKRVVIARSEADDLLERTRIKPEVKA